VRPSVMLLGFLLGSSGAICFGLSGVAFIFWLLGPDYPELRAEVEPLLGHLGRFLALAIASGLSFEGMLRQRRWRHVSVTILVLVLAGVVAQYTLADQPA
jgi:hypothetical protein